MNEKFFSLPEEKQLAIINAGYRVFSQSSYKKSPVSEIAAEAGISKSLLFHYFKNKRELYLFLIENAAETTYKYLYDFGCNEEEDIFEIMHKGLKAKVALMRKYPELTFFTLKAYYETDPEVCGDIQKIIGRIASFDANAKFLKIKPDKFIEGIDLQMMYMDMYLASEGYLWEKSNQGHFNVDEVEKDFIKMIDFWKKIYLRKEDGNEDN
ncbi:MAG: TetR/AcrR family transcriptional regulator [Oscillospiraceae bacterium]